MRISDWSSDVCSSDLVPLFPVLARAQAIDPIQIALEQLHLLPVFETHKIIGLDRYPDRDRRKLLRRLDRFLGAQRTEAHMNLLDHKRSVADRAGMVRDIGTGTVRGEFDTRCSSEATRTGKESARMC